MESQCHDDISRLVAKQNTNVETTSRTFSQLVSKLNLIILTEKELINPCVQVAMYDKDLKRQGRYHEIIEPAVPFCSFVWCGFDENVFTKKLVAPWTCMPSR